MFCLTRRFYLTYNVFLYDKTIKISSYAIAKRYKSNKQAFLIAFLILQKR